MMLDAGSDGLIGKGTDGLRFGPWNEVTLNIADNGQVSCFDLDHHKPLTPPEPVLKAMHDANACLNLRDATKEDNPAVRWVLDSGADIKAVSANTLVMFCSARDNSGITDPKLNPQWDSLLTPQYVLWALRQREPIARVIASGSGPLRGLDLYVSAPDRLCFFCTREGNSGVLQVVEMPKKSNAVKIRYKLVQKDKGQLE